MESPSCFFFIESNLIVVYHFLKIKAINDKLDNFKLKSIIMLSNKNVALSLHMWNSLKQFIILFILLMIMLIFKESRNNIKHILYVKIKKNEKEKEDFCSYNA